jgi:hypothetical protein
MQKKWYFRVMVIRSVNKKTGRKGTPNSTQKPHRNSLRQKKSLHRLKRHQRNIIVLMGFPCKFTHIG